MDTVAFTAEVPFTLAHTIWLILYSNVDDAALDNNTLAVVLAGVKKVVVPRMAVTLTIFTGLVAMMVPYRPKTIEKAIAWPLVAPLVAELLARSFTVPALFLKYNFSSKVLIANSPAAKSAAKGTADAVVVR